MKTIRIIKGNDLTLYIPVVLMSSTGATALQASSLDYLAVSLCSCTTVYPCVPLADGSKIKIQLPASLPCGSYSLDISAEYEGRNIRSRIDGAVEIVGNTRQSNWQDYIAGTHATTDAQVYVAESLMTDEEFEELKDEYRGKISDLSDAIEEAETTTAEAQTAAYNAAYALNSAGVQSACAAAIAATGVSVDLSPVTSRLDSTTYGLQAIKNAVDAIPGGGGGGASMDDIQAALDALKLSLQGASPETLTSVAAAIAALPSFPLDYAKETTAEAARVAAVGAQTAAQGISIPTDYAKAAQVPTVAQIQNGLATASAVSTIDQKIGAVETLLANL